MKRSHFCAHIQQGFTLLEVLITLVIFSVGLLGIAGVQLAGIRYIHNANVRYQAMLQAIDMAGRMRANVVGVTAGSYNSISGTGSDPGCISSSCTPTQMAQTDRYQWNTTNARVLPNGAGTVTPNGTLYSITLTWQEMGGLSSATTSQSLTLNIDI